MKVLLINGSPHERGCTYTALSEIERQLHSDGLDSEIHWIGTRPVPGCIACGKCHDLGHCFYNDGVVECAEKLAQADALIVGSPVYYASPNGSAIAFLDRLFYSTPRPAKIYKPGASVVSARRAGTTASFDALNKYFTISQMPIVSSQYWNEVHGCTPEQVLEDKEGLQIMRTLARNMAWLLKSIEAGRQSGVSLPESEPAEFTSFIR